MMMQNPDGGVEFFSDFLASPTAARLDQANAPITDWRFLPKQTGRQALRTDLAHSGTSMKPRMRQGRADCSVLGSNSLNTLCFG